MFQKAEIALRRAGGEIRHGLHRSVSSDGSQAFPGQTRERINLLRRVNLAGFGLEREREIVPDLGWREHRWRRPDPKTAMDGTTAAAWHGGQRLRDGAAQLESQPSHRKSGKWLS